MNTYFVQVSKCKTLAKFHISATKFENYYCPQQGNYVLSSLSFDVTEIGHQAAIEVRQNFNVVGSTKKYIEIWYNGTNKAHLNEQNLCPNFSIPK